MLEDDPDYPWAARTRLRGSGPDSDLFCGVDGSEEEDSNYTDDSDIQSCASGEPQADGWSDAGSWCESVYSSNADGEDPED